MPELRILGIDPGTRVVGWGVLDVLGTGHRLVACGAIRTQASEPVHRRLAAIAAELSRLAAEHAPDEVAVEEVFHAKNAKSAIRLGEGRGAAIAAVARLPVFTYAANEVKKAVTGRGGASKEAVARMVALLLGLTEPPQPVDATDALALAICHAGRRSSGDALRRAGAAAGTEIGPERSTQ